MATQEERLAELILDLGTDYKTILAMIGALNNLETAATNLVQAVNEVKATADAAVAGTAPDATSMVKGIVELATDSEALAMSATDLVLTPGNLGAIRNVANGLAGLDASGKVAAAQLPSFVDDVVEAANFAALPGSGESGKLYVTLDNNKSFRWSGSAYVEIQASPGSTDEVTEGATNLYYTAARAATVADSRIATLVGDTDVDLAAAYAAAKA